MSIYLLVSECALPIEWHISLVHMSHSPIEVYLQKKAFTEANIDWQISIDSFGSRVRVWLAGGIVVLGHPLIETDTSSVHLQYSMGRAESVWTAKRRWGHGWAVRLSYWLLQDGFCNWAPSVASAAYTNVSVLLQSMYRAMQTLAAWVTKQLGWLNHYATSVLMIVILAPSTCL